MNFQGAFHKYSCFLQEKCNSNSSEHEWISEKLSSKQPDGSWRLVGASDTFVAQVQPDGSCDFKPLKT